MELTLKPWKVVGGAVGVGVGVCVGVGVGVCVCVCVGVCGCVIPHPLTSSTEGT